MMGGSHCDPFLIGLEKLFLCVTIIVSIDYHHQDTNYEKFCTGPRETQSARIFTLINDYKETIWPAITPGENFNGGGFALKSTESIVFPAPLAWSGRIWARTGCKTRTIMALAKLAVAAQHSNVQRRVNLTLHLPNLPLPDFYDVSLLDGFNVPIVVKPINAKGNCRIAGCDTDLRVKCPKDLAVIVGGKTVGCRSACDVLDTNKYCCRGNFGNAATCQPTYYSKTFKSACPAVYSYAYDDPSSIFTCSGTDYVVTFCSSRSQTVCTYHDPKIDCSGSNSLNSFIGRWWALMLGSPLLVSLGMTI